MHSIVCSPAPTFYYLERELLFNNKVRNLPQTLLEREELLAMALERALARAATRALAKALAWALSSSSLKASSYKDGEGPTKLCWLFLPCASPGKGSPMKFCSFPLLGSQSDKEFEIRGQHQTSRTQERQVLPKVK